MSEARSIVDLLRERAESRPDGAAYAFVADGEVESARLTYAELDRAARGIGAYLRHAGAAGERALLLYPQGLEFVAAFYGCLFAGTVAVPAYPPRNERGLPRLQAILQDARPRVILTTSSLMQTVRPWLEGAPGSGSALWLATDAVPHGLWEEWRSPRADSATLAFLQYTSGSTASPRGVMVSHGNLLHNLALLKTGWNQSSGSVVLGWLPLFHDMGLIGNVLESLYLGAPCILMPPASFLQRPVRWLAAVSRYRATLSGGPNFAFDLCVQRITPEQREGLDLGSWTAAFNGAEPVRSDTLERFYEAFAPCGLRKEALQPGYGLAEGTLVVSAGRAPGTPPLVEAFQAAALEQNRLVAGPAGAPDHRALVGCGRVVGDQRVRIVDPATGGVCPPDAVGEIWVSGGSVAQGYWARPEETEGTFRARIAGSGEGPFLRTGDLGFLHGGELFIAGRAKDLIIVNGRNHYPQDVELTAVRSHPGLRPNCGAAFSVERGGEERLAVAVEVDRRSLGGPLEKIVDAIRAAVVGEHEVAPYAVVLLRTGTIPKTSSGKIQRSECRARFVEGTLEAVRVWTEEEADRAGLAAPPAGGVRLGDVRALEVWLSGRIARRAGLSPGEIDPREAFARYGLDSVAAAGLSGELEEALGRRFSPTLLYEHPSIRQLARHLADEAREAPGLVRAEPAPAAGAIAVVGIGCRFPGADGPDAFWDLLERGADAVAEVPPSRWDLDALYDPDPHAPGKMSTRWGGFLPQVDRFDAAFFSISPREAVRMDPQQRLLLEVAWEALEDAGIDPDALAGSSTGVFVGISTSDYGQLQFTDPALSDAYAGTGGALSIAANRISYVLDLRGPSMAVDTACSSSLVAVHLACRALASGECELALAGGANVLLSPTLTVNFTKAGFMSPDGRCRAFDSRANGYVRGEGAGVVVLKPLDSAVRDGDPVYAVIRGSAVTQDGRTNGLTAPSRSAQEEVLRKAFGRAGVSPGEVQYVEAHGTGTPLGDPIEAAALGAVLAEGRAPGARCSIGSVKSNIGHLEAAAGIAGLVKVALSLRHRRIPRSLHYERPNPEIPFARLPLEVQRESSDWPGESGRRVAGVSSFGFGGTNAHVVLAEAPPVPGRSAGPDGPVVLLPLSARAPQALRALARRYAEFLAPGGEGRATPLRDLSHTAGARRAHHDHRLALTGATPEELRTGLEDFLGERAHARLAVGRRVQGREPRVAFVFSGQGPQWCGMGRRLLDREPAFRGVLEECDQLLRRHAGWSLLEELAADGSASRLGDTDVAQPVIFAVQVGLAALWRAWGVRAEAVVGHSVGEVAAAYTAGVLSLEDAVRIVVHRGRLMQRAAGLGAMAAVGLSPGEAAGALAPYQGRLWVAALNDPGSVVLSGEPRALEEVLTAQEAREVLVRRVSDRYAFHSPQMHPLADELERICTGISPRAASIPFFSTVTGLRMEGTEIGPAYWGRNVREPVLFSDAVRALAGDGLDTFLEIGPHPVLAGSIARCLDGAGAEGVALPSLRRDEDERTVMLGSLGVLYTRGLDVAWSAIDPGPVRCARLPRYPWQRERFWLETAAVPDRPPPVHVHLPGTHLWEGMPGADRASSPHREEDCFPASPREGRLSRETLLAPAGAERAGVLEAYLHECCAAVLRTGGARLDVERPLVRLGLDSLMALELKNRVECELEVSLPLNELFAGSSIRGLADLLLRRMTGPADGRGPSVRAGGDPAECALSRGQRAIWLFHQLDPGSALFNVMAAVRIASPLDADALRRAVQHLVDRHPALRTVFALRDGQPVQRVLEQAKASFEVEDASGWDEPLLHERLSADAHLPFDLENGPLLRATLFRRGPDEHVLLLVMHHIATDFWSNVVVLKDLTACYMAEAAGVRPEPCPPGVRYTDYVRWQEELLAGPAGERLWEYWSRQLSPEVPVLFLPTDRPRPTAPTHAGALHRFRIGAGRTRRLHALARERGATVYMVLLAAFQVLLHRYAGQEEVVVASPMAGRGRAEFEDTVGYFMNPVLLRGSLPAGTSFDALLEQARETVAGALQHQDLPLHAVAERLQGMRDPGRPGLFQAMFILNRPHRLEEAGIAGVMLGEPGLRFERGGLVMEPLPLEERVSPCDLCLWAGTAEEELAARLQYSTELFDRATAVRLAASFEVLLDGLLATPGRAVAEVPLLSGGELRRVVSEWPEGADVPRDPRPVHRLFEEQVARSPHAVAVAGEGGVTYEELNRRANRLAHHLRGLGVRADTCVGVCLERSVEMIVGVLGVLKAGGAYLPLDPEYPVERRILMLEDARAPVLVTRRGIAAELSGGGWQVVAVDADRAAIDASPGTDPSSSTDGESLAYVIYTSGSTGRPKGTMVPHAALSNHTAAAVAGYALTAGDRVLQFASISFDASAEEIFPALASGAALVLRPGGAVGTVARLFELCGEAGVTVLDLPTAYWHLAASALGEGEAVLPPSVRLVIIGGERALPERVALWRERVPASVRLVNTYGPTEATIVATRHELSGPADGREVPIGRPIDNVRCYVLDASMQPVPAGVPGQLHVGGAGVARGYLGGPRPTAERFVPDPFSTAPGARLYATGDRVRHLADGALEFLGRGDGQVKVRGFRVEPGEVEAALGRHPDVRDAVVVAREDAPGQRRLVAYLVAREAPAPPVRELRGFVSELLPEYMVPAVFVVLDALPLTPGGKVDRRALPAPEQCSADPPDGAAAPRTPEEELLAGIWAQVLDRERVGIHDNFFELGGDSILAVQAISRANRHGLGLTPRLLFQHPTVAALAGLAGADGTPDALSCGEVATPWP